MRKGQLCAVLRGEFLAAECKDREMERNHIHSRSRGCLSHGVVREANEIQDVKNLYKYKELLQLGTSLQGHKQLPQTADTLHFSVLRNMEHGGLLLPEALLRLFLVLWGREGWGCGMN